MPFEISQAFEFAKFVVERLLADLQSRREIRRPHIVRAGVLEHSQMGDVDVFEAVIMEALEHSSLHRLERHSEQGTDEGRPGRGRLTGCSKNT